MSPLPFTLSLKPCNQTPSRFTPRADRRRYFHRIPDPRLIGFGGVLPLTRRELVEPRRGKWLDADEFNELLGLCQFLPGGNVINLSVAIGMKFRGFAGALAGLLGLIFAPSLIVIALGVLYQHTRNDPHIRHLFAGLAASAAGLLIAHGGEDCLGVAARAGARRDRRACVRRDCVASVAAAAHHADPHAGVGFSCVAGVAMMQNLVSLAAIFSQLSLLAFGGGNTILPEMQRQVVEVHRWMSQADFSAMFALAQAAPGPNMMIVTLIGWHVAGWPGRVRDVRGEVRAVVAGDDRRDARVERFKDRPWRRYVQLGLVPMTAGSRAASAALIARASDTAWTLAGITLAVAALSYRTRIHPLWLLAAGALVGLTGFGQ